jgi:molecular chaperone GrpE
MAEDKNNEIKNTSNSSEKNAAEEEVIENESINDQINPPDKITTEEPKQLEEKEHFELEYFSKDEVLEKVKTIETELAEVKSTADKLNKENNESKTKFMHLQAEFENAQKRWNKSRLNLKTQYTASVLKSFLSLYDSFQKALANENETEKKILDSFYNQFMSIFKSYGAEPINVKLNDLFDYSKHEALTSIEREDVPENSILEIIQDGWKYGKEVIRYTKVVISRKPKPPEPEPKEEEIEEKIEEQKTPEEEKTEKIKEKEKKKEKKSKKHKEDKKHESSE